MTEGWKRKQETKEKRDDKVVIDRRNVFVAVIRKGSERPLLYDMLLLCNMPIRCWLVAVRWRVSVRI
jgi:hypothetical protein